MRPRRHIPDRGRLVQVAALAVLLPVTLGCALVMRPVTPGLPYTTGQAEVTIDDGSDLPTLELPLFSGFHVPADDPSSADPGATAVYKSRDGWELYLEQFDPAELGMVTVADARDPDGERLFLLDGDRAECTGDGLIVTPERFSGRLVCRDPGDGDHGPTVATITFEATTER